MQIASFILVNDRLLHRLEDQLESTFHEVPSVNAAAFQNYVPAKLQEIGSEHPISIPFGSFLPLDQAAERQHERILSAFEDPAHPSKLSQMARAANTPMFYVSPGRVHNFLAELETLRLAQQIHPEDVETLLGKRVVTSELPAVTNIIEQFRHDLYQVYSDAAQEGKGVVVMVMNQPDDVASEDGFPKAA
ncbi:MAG TPA: hypothetical protein VHV83_10560 [Armatimonadota bacterium]|nr:hypothetical protein [Armatimonadota bacterium]